MKKKLSHDTCFCKSFFLLGRGLNCIQTPMDKKKVHETWSFFEKLFCGLGVKYYLNIFCGKCYFYNTTCVMQELQDLQLQIIARVAIIPKSSRTFYYHIW